MTEPTQDAQRMIEAWAGCVNRPDRRRFRVIPTILHYLADED